MREIPVLIPDMPSARELAPWLERMDTTRRYTNFGPLCVQFEDQIARLVAKTGSQVHVTAASSGTAALELALAALVLPDKAEVLVPALSFGSTAGVPARLGLTPVFADVDPKTWTMTPQIAQAALAHGDIRAVVPVAAYGLPLPEQDWDEFARRTGLPVILDAAGALGGQRPGKCCPAVFSLHATKVLGVGEGGLVAGADPGFIQTVRMLSNNGYSKWMCRRVGGNMKLSEYHAAVGLAQLERLPGVRERVEKVGRAYAAGLHALTGRIRPQPAPATLLRSVMCVKLETAHAEPVAGVMAQTGVETRRWYCPPLCEHPAFSEFTRLGPDGGPNLPVTADLGQRLLGLPFHTSLQPDDVARVCAALAAALQDLESA